MQFFYCSYVVLSSLNSSFVALCFDQEPFTSSTYHGRICAKPILTLPTCHLPCRHTTGGGEGAFHLPCRHAHALPTCHRGGVGAIHLPCRHATYLADIPQGGEGAFHFLADMHIPCRHTTGGEGELYAYLADMPHTLLTYHSG